MRDYKIKEIQWFLKFWYDAYKGKVYSKATPELIEAIKKFQKDKGLPQTGKFGTRTNALAQNWVRTISQWLRKNGYLNQDKYITSYPGRRWRNAFYAWNKAHKLDEFGHMNNKKLKMFQEEDLPNMQDFSAKGINENTILLEWDRPIIPIKTLVYETNAKGTKYGNAIGSSNGWRWPSDTLKPGTRKYYRIRGTKIINGVQCFTNYSKVDYGQTSSGKLSKLRDVINDWKGHIPWEHGYKYLCETWCKVAYNEAGLNYYGTCCAGNHRRNHANSGTNVPNGALVFSSPSYHNSICQTCGGWDGHVAIYLDGKCYSSQEPFGIDFFTWKDKWGYGGWSKDGNNF